MKKLGVGVLLALVAGCGGHESSSPFHASGDSSASGSTTSTAAPPATATPPAPSTPPTAFYRVAGWLPYWTYTNGQATIDAETGRERWRYDANPRIEGGWNVTCRGVALWRSGAGRPTVGVFFDGLVCVQNTRVQLWCTFYLVHDDDMK